LIYKLCSSVASYTIGSLAGFIPSSVLVACNSILKQMGFQVGAVVRKTCTALDNLIACIVEIQDQHCTEKLTSTSTYVVTLSCIMLRVLLQS